MHSTDQVQVYILYIYIQDWNLNGQAHNRESILAPDCVRPSTDIMLWTCLFLRISLTITLCCVSIYVDQVTGIIFLWASDTIWWHRSGSTLAQVMACCLTVPSHYLNKCWLIIKCALWHSGLSLGLQGLYSTTNCAYNILGRFTIIPQNQIARVDSFTNLTKRWVFRFRLNASISSHNLRAISQAVLINMCVWDYAFKIITHLTAANELIKMATKTLCVGVWGGGWWVVVVVTKPISSVPLFSPVFQHYQCTSYILSITFIFDWCRCMQLSCSNNCRIWMWFNWFKLHICKIQFIPNGEINEQSFNNPHPCIGQMPHSDPVLAHTISFIQSSKPQWVRPLIMHLVSYDIHMTSVTVASTWDPEHSCTKSWQVRVQGHCLSREGDCNQCVI